MPEIPINIVLEAENRTGGEIQRTLGLTNEQMSALNTHINGLIKEQASLDQSTSKLTTTFKGLIGELRSVKMHFKAAFESLTAGGMMAGALKMVGQMNMQLYDLSKTARLTGQNFGEMRRGIEDITAKTRLSIVESTQFYKTVSEGTQGVRMGAGEVSKMAQTLSREFGPSLEDVTKAFQKLSELQQKDIFLFRELREEMSPEELSAYAMRLVVVNKASQDQINTLFRLQIARTLEGTALTKEQKDLRSYNDTVQEFQKSLQNLTVSVGQPLLKIFNELREPVTKVLDGIASFVEKSPKLTLAIGGVAMFGPALMGLGSALGGIGRMASGIGGGIRGALGGIGRKKGQSSQDAIFVQPVGLGGLGGGTPGKGMGVPGMAGAPGGRGWSAATRGRVAGYGAVAGIAGHVGGMIAEEAGAPAWASAGMKTLGNIGAGVGMGAMAGPWGALIGGIGGLAVSIPTLWDAFSGTEEATKKVTDAQKEQAEAVKASTEEIMKAEKQAGMGVGEAGFGAQYAISQIAKRRLMQSGMSTEEAGKEVEAGARGKGGGQYIKVMGGISAEEMRREMQGLDIEKFIGAERAKKEFEKLPEIAKILKMQVQGMSFIYLRQETEQIKALFDGINASLATQASLHKELYGDVAAVQGLLSHQISNHEQSIAMLKQQRDQTRAILEGLGGIEKVRSKILELQSLGAARTSEQRREMNRLQGYLLTEEAQTQAIASEQATRAQKQRELVDAYDPQIQLQERQLSLMESQAQMAKEMYLGAGPTLEFQIAQVQLLEKQKNLVAAQVKEAQRLLAADPTRVDLQNKLVALQEKQVQLTTKQLSLTKNLREGYLDAMTTMTNAEGTFSKFVLRREMGMGELQRQFLAAGGLRAGMLGAGAAQHTMRWRPGGGPGALQFMSPQQLMQLGQGFGEEYGPMTMFPNVPAAMAATPFGQFGAQAPESGMMQLGGRAGQAITVPSGRLNQQQAAEMQAIQKRAMAKAEKGESTVAERARAEEIRKEAAAGSFEGQVLQKMDTIIGLMGGGGVPPKPQAAGPDKATQDAVRQGSKEGAKEGAEAAEKKKQEAQARDYTRQAQEMRRGTGTGEGPTSAEAAYKKSERIEQQRFQLFQKTFSDWDAAAKGVSTAGIPIGGRGGTRGAGAQGVLYAGQKPGAPMTVEGAKFDKPFTAEQVQAVSRRLGAKAEYEPQAPKALLSMLSAAPTAPKTDVSGYLEEELGGIEEKMSAKGRARDIVQATLERNRAELAGESPAEKKLRTEKEKQAQAQAELVGLKKDEKRLVAESGEEAGWLNKSGRVLGDMLSNAGRAFGNITREIVAGAEEEAASTKEEAAQIRAKYEAAYAESDKNAIASRDREKIASRDLFSNRAKQIALQKQINEYAAKSKEREAEAAKAAEDRKRLAENIAKGEQLLQEHQKGLGNLAKDKETLEKQLVQEKARTAADEKAAAQQRKVIEEQSREVIKTMSKDSEKMAKEEASFRESKINFEGRELQKTRQQYDREQKTLSDQIAKRQENITTLEKIVEAGYGGAEAEKQLAEHRNALNELIVKQTNLQDKGFGGGAEAGIHGTDEETAKAAAAAAAGAAAGIHGLDQATARAAAEAVEKKPAGARLIEEEPEATRPSVIPHYVDLAASEKRLAYLRKKTGDFLPNLEKTIAQDENQLRDTVKKKNEALVMARPDPAFAEMAKMGAEEAGRKQYDIAMSRVNDPRVMGMNLTEIPLGKDSGQNIAKDSGQKQVEQLEKLNTKVTEQTKSQEQASQAQVTAQKEAGQNLKSTLEQQKIDVSPVVTSVNPACATAIAGASTGGWIARMADGGRLPGFGGGDRVLALLEPGEFVVNKKAAATFPGLLDSVNKFQGGGMAGMAPSPSIARQGGISPMFNISVRGDSAKTLVGSVNKTLSNILNEMFAPQGTSGRLYDLGV